MPHVRVFLGHCFKRNKVCLLGGEKLYVMETDLKHMKCFGSFSTFCIFS